MSDYQEAVRKLEARTAEYPVQRTIRVSYANMREVRDWCWEHYIDCLRMGPFWYFRNEEDAVMFMLRWS